MRLILIQTTTSNYQHAEKIATVLIEQTQVVCTQIYGPITSLYRWQGRMEKQQEFILVAKVLEQYYRQVADCISRHHTYEIPEIVAVPVCQVGDSYLEWVMSNHD